MSVCDLGFLVFNLGFEVGFWKVFGRVLGCRKRVVLPRFSRIFGSSFGLKF